MTEFQDIASKWASNIDSISKILEVAAKHPPGPDPQRNSAVKKKCLVEAQSLIQSMMMLTTSANQRATELPHAAIELEL